MRILGIDPGSRVTGYGIIESSGGRLRYLHAGQVQCSQGELPERLMKIHGDLQAIVSEYQPQEVAIEKVFVNRNVASALTLGQARGAAICAVAAADRPVHEYAPTQIKNAVVGTGRADKAQVQHMIQILLALKAKPPSDAADALAVAVCHANVRNTFARSGVQLSRAWGGA